MSKRMSEKKIIFKCYIDNMKINRKVVIRVNGYIYKETRGNTEMVGLGR